MASIDGGHYFLTVLAPVRKAWVKGQHHETTAPAILLREALTTMPTAHQTPITSQNPENSPFAKSTLTHFARFAVIDRMGYNGYIAADPIATTLMKTEPDRYGEELGRPYLLFAAEFDAPSGSRSADLATYLRELWDVMGDSLREIFSNCIGFDDTTVNSAAGFINYIKQCEIETTMPFNYYWVDTPNLPSLSWQKLALGALPLGMIAGFAMWKLMIAIAGGGGGGFAIAIAALFALAAALAAAIGFAVWRITVIGDKRFPASPDGELVTVLKSLRLQNTFAKFVIQNQTSSPEELHTAFARYLADNRVSQPQPSHPAGAVYKYGANRA